MQYRFPQRCPVDPDSGPLDPASAVVGVITLTSTILLSVIPRRFFKFYVILIGIVIGIAASVFLGVFNTRNTVPDHEPFNLLDQKPASESCRIRLISLC